MNVKSPILLNKSTLQERGRFAPLTLSVDLRLEDISSASMTLSDKDIAVSVNDWVRLTTVQGDAGVFVVTGVDTDAVKKTRSVQMKHAAFLLGYETIFGKYNWESITHAAGQEYPNVREMLTWLIGKQSGGVWALDACAFSGRYAYEVSDTSLYNALEYVRCGLVDAYYEYDTTELPFKISLRKRNRSTVASEIRLNRNVVGLKVNTDTSEMYTRVYPRGHFDSENGYIELSPTKYIQENTSTYGVISCIDTDERITTAAELRSWAEERLHLHSHPIISIECDGLALAAATGESLDRFTVGRLCRVAIPDQSVNETVSSVSFPDVLGKPERCTVRMSNYRRNVENILRDVVSSTSSYRSDKSGGHGGHGGGMKDETKWLTATTTLSQFQLQEIDGSQLWQQREAIVGCVGRVEGLEGHVTTIEGSTLWLTRNEIAAVTGKLETDADGNLIVKDGSGLFIKRDGVKLGVYDDGNLTAGIMVSKLNDGTTTTKISATRIDLQGYVTASQLSAVSAQISNLMSGQTTAAKLVAVDSNISNLEVTNTLTLGYNHLSLNDAVRNIDNGSASGGTVTFTYHRFYGQDGTFSFNIGDTAYYRNGVANAWNDGAGTARGVVTTDRTPASTQTLSIGGHLDYTVQVKRHGASVYTDVTTIRVNAPSISNYGVGQLYAYERDRYIAVGTGSRHWYYTGN